MSIPETLIKIKGRGGLGLLAQGVTGILILGCFFMLGRISVLASQRAPSEPLEVIVPPLVTTDVPHYQEGGQPSAPDSKPINEPASWTAVASKTGKIYYLQTCTGLGRIKPENRVYFASEKEAQAAGLAKAASCH
jgi:hypothetical protein